MSEEVMLEGACTAEATSEGCVQQLTIPSEESAFYLTDRQSGWILAYLIFMALVGAAGTCLGLYIYFTVHQESALPSLLIIALLSIAPALLGGSIQYIHRLYLLCMNAATKMEDGEQMSDDALRWLNRGSLIYFYTRPPVIAIVCFFIFAAMSEGLTDVFFSDPTISDSGYMAIMAASFLLSATGKVFDGIVSLSDGLSNKMKSSEGNQEKGSTNTSDNATEKYDSKGGASQDK